MLQHSFNILHYKEIEQSMVPMDPKYAFRSWCMSKYFDFLRVFFELPLEIKVEKFLPMIKINNINICWNNDEYQWLTSHQSHMSRINWLTCWKRMCSNIWCLTVIVMNSIILQDISDFFIQTNQLIYIIDESIYFSTHGWCAIDSTT